MKRKSIRFHLFGHKKLLQDLFKSKFYLLRSIIEYMIHSFSWMRTFYLLFPLDLNRQEKVFRFKNNRFQVIYTFSLVLKKSWRIFKSLSPRQREKMVSEEIEWRETAFHKYGVEGRNSFSSRRGVEKRKKRGRWNFAMLVTRSDFWRVREGNRVTVSRPCSNFQSFFHSITLNFSIFDRQVCAFILASPFVNFPLGIILFLIIKRKKSCVPKKIIFHRIRNGKLGRSATERESPSCRATKWEIFKENLEDGRSFMEKIRRNESKVICKKNKNPKRVT